MSIIGGLYLPRNSQTTNEENFEVQIIQLGNLNMPLEQIKFLDTKTEDYYSPIIILRK